jgi:hypothetical protein
MITKIQVLAPSPPITPTLSTPTVGTQDYQTVVLALQAEVTIAHLQAKIKTLPAQVGAQMPSTVTKSLAPKPRDTSSRMALIKSNMATMTTKFTQWMLEVQQLLNS